VVNRWQQRALDLAARRDSHRDRLEWRFRVMRAGSEVAAYNQAMRERAASARVELAAVRAHLTAGGEA
jgi:hypothetical protein